MWMDLGVSFGQIFLSRMWRDNKKPVSGIFHEQKVIGAGFNLLVNQAEEEDEKDAVDPLDWLNCAADKANAAEDEAVIMHLRQ